MSNHVHNEWHESFIIIKYKGKEDDCMGSTNNSLPVDEEKINSHFKSLLDDSLDSMDSSGEDIKDNPRRTVFGKTSGTLMNNDGLMSYTDILESMDRIFEAIDEIDANADIASMPVISDNGGDNEKELLAELNQLFTPVLVSQALEGEISDKIQESYSEASVLTEKNVIKFDDETRMSQLISLCALLLQKKKNTEKYQIYKKAALLRNQMKLAMQKEEYDAARTLAQKYLVNVATTNNSSVARDAANKLLPATQH